MILLDTQVLVWSSFDDDRLGRRCREIIGSADRSEQLFMSPISAWEIAMLVGKGRFRLNMPIQDWIARAADAHDVRWVDLTPVIAASAGILADLHGDPADRLIIATAISLDLTLVTADRKILAYGQAGQVRVVDARR